MNSDRSTIYFIVHLISVDRYRFLAQAPCRQQSHLKLVLLQLWWNLDWKIRQLVVKNDLTLTLDDEVRPDEDLFEPTDPLEGDVGTGMVTKIELQKHNTRSFTWFQFLMTRSLHHDSHSSAAFPRFHDQLVHEQIAEAEPSSQLNTKTTRRGWFFGFSMTHTHSLILLYPVSSRSPT